MAMREKSYLGLSILGFHRVAYYEWGAAGGAPVALCVHGLTRTGRCFDRLAEALEDRYRIACPDLPGRGKSHWFANPALYRPPSYLGDLNALIARMDAPEVDWIGTSLGGILGMMLAAQPNTPIRKLVVNDVGPFIDKQALGRIATYVGQDPTFRSLEALEAYLREVHAPFGPLSDAEWRHLAIHSARHDEAADVWRLHYDPALADPVPRGRREGRGPVGAVGGDPLPGADHPRRRVRHPLARDRRGDADPRPRGGARRASRDRPRPGADGPGADRADPRLAAGLTGRLHLDPPPLRQGAPGDLDLGRYF